MIDSTYPNVCYCLIESYELNSLMWASFTYKGSYGAWKSIAYPLDLSYGYHLLSVTPIKQNGGFLICGYEDKTGKFTAFILNIAYSINQAYLPDFTGGKMFSDSPVKVNIFYQEFYIDTGIIDKPLISIANNYYSLL